MDDDVSAPGPRARPERRGAYTKGVERRQEILDRAIEVFAAKGASGTSLRAIGEAIGVSHAALKHYFSSREELLLEVLRTNEERLNVEHPALAEASAVGMMSGASRRNVVIPGLIALYTSLMAEAVQDGNEASRRYFSERFDTVRGVVIELIERGQRDGTVRRDVPAEAAAALIVAASDGLQVQWLLDPSIELVRTLEMLELMLAAPTDAAGAPASVASSALPA